MHILHFTLHKTKQGYTQVDQSWVRRFYQCTQMAVAMTMVEETPELALGYSGGMTIHCKYQCGVLHLSFNSFNKVFVWLSSLWKKK